VISLTPAKVLTTEYCKRAASNTQAAESHFESRFLADPERNVDRIGRRRGAQLDAGGSNRNIVLRCSVTRREKRESESCRFCVTQNHVVARSFARVPREAAVD